MHACTKCRCARSGSLRLHLCGTWARVWLTRFITSRGKIVGGAARREALPLHPSPARARRQSTVEAIRPEETLISDWLRCKRRASGGGTANQSSERQKIKNWLIGFVFSVEEEFGGLRVHDGTDFTVKTCLKEEDVHAQFTPWFFFCLLGLHTTARWKIPRVQFTQTMFS